MIWPIAILVASSFADGITTVQAIKRGWVETNPILVWLYGTNTPSAAKVLGAGMGIIAAESVLAYWLMTLSPYFMIPFLCQSVAHTYFAYHNSKA